MKRKSTIIICAVAATVIAAALFSAIWFGPKASLKRELNISVPKNAKIVKSYFEPKRVFFCGSRVEKRENFF